MQHNKVNTLNQIEFSKYQELVKILPIGKQLSSHIPGFHSSKNFNFLFDSICSLSQSFENARARGQ